MLTENEEIEYIALLTSEAIEISRHSFWCFCVLLAPDFYKDTRPHLRILCDTLQNLYEGKLLKADGKPYTKLNIAMPPRHGKSRTLTLFSAWVLGVNNREKIITASFNDDLAQEFSRHTRDTIAEEKNLQSQIVYSDIFSARIKHGDSSYQKWALEGQFFNYKGAGIGGSITGRGGSIIIIDDPVKDAETAYNEAALEKIWLWYTGTIISRAEEGSLQILCMTPWASKDMGALTAQKQPGQWYELSMPAYTDGKMLCPEIMSYESYVEKKAIGDDNIFSANYDLQRVDIKGRLYTGFETYAELPENTTNSCFYCDTADEGDDYLCAIMARRKGVYLYVTGVYYTQDKQEVTEIELSKQLKDTKTTEGIIESNNGGKAFARNIQRITKENGFMCSISWFHQCNNKKARILTNAAIAQKYVYFPEGWAALWPDFYSALMAYQKEGKNKHDDAPDALTGLIEKYGEGRGKVGTPSTNIRTLARF